MLEGSGWTTIHKRLAGSRSKITLLAQRPRPAGLQIQARLRRRTTPFHTVRRIGTFNEQGLIKAGFGTRVFYTRQAGYDTHYTQLPAHADLLNVLGDSLHAFLEDLRAARLEDQVAVLVFSEFGRRVADNGYGTDYGTAGPVLLAGGRIQSGLLGTTPSMTDLVDGDLRVGIDFRRIYRTLLEDWLGLAAEQALGGAFEPWPLFRV